MFLRKMNRDWNVIRLLSEFVIFLKNEHCSGQSGAPLLKIRQLLLFPEKLSFFMNCFLLY